MADATETVQIARLGPHDRTGPGCFNANHLRAGVTGFKCWTDPLADTPEGDHEWCEILRWAKGWLEEHGLTMDMTCRRGWWAGNVYRGKAWSDTVIVTDGESDCPKELTVRLLAAAIKGETGA